VGLELVAGAKKAEGYKRPDDADALQRETDSAEGVSEVVKG
jgi:hypothetical protein